MKSWKIVVCVTLVSLLVFSGAAVPEDTDSQTVNWPDTRAGRMAEAFIGAFRAEDEAVMRRFTLENRDEASLGRLPIESRMAQFRQIRQQIGTFEVVAVTADGDLKANVIVQSVGLGLFLDMSFELQAEEPYKLAHFGLRPSAPPKESGPDFSEWENLQELADTACKEGNVPAIAIIVVHHGEIVDRAVAGVRQAGSTDAVRLGARFQMGSVSKSITATLIGALIDEGKLRWDMTIAEVLPDMDIGDDYREVTLEQLLQHRSGLPPYADDRVDDFPDLAEPGRSATEERTLFVQQVLQDEPVTEPGAFNYSNAGYAVAALMAERIAGEPYEDLMQTVLFAPAQMPSAKLGWPASDQDPNQPRGHFGNPPDLRVQAIDEEPWQSYMLPAGGVSCNIEDLARFARLHLNGLAGKRGLLRAETIQRLHRQMTENSGESGYAAGWLLEKAPSGESKHSHGGSAGTFYATLSLYPERDLAIAIAVNCAGTAVAMVEGLSQAIYARWSQDPGAER